MVMCHKNIRRALALLLGAGFIASCTTHPTALVTPSVEEAMRPVAESRTAGEARTRQPEAATEAKPGELTETQPELTLKKPRARGPRFDLSARDVAIKTILLSLASKLKANIVVDPDIEGTATLELRDVTLDEALVHLLVPHGLHHQVEDGVIRVSRDQMQVRLFNLNYVMSRREGESRLGASPGAGDGGMTSSRVLSREEANLWGEIEKGLSNLVYGEGIGPAAANKTRGEGPSFSIQRQAGIVLVRHHLKTLHEVARFLEEVEGSVQRQVFIQAKIIEVSLGGENRLGIDWRRVPTSRLAAAMGESGGAYGVHDQSPEEVIESLSRQGQVHMLSSPKIATLNNQRALIKVGTESVYYPGEEEGPASRPAAMPMSEGIVLDVVPQINANGNIMMSINTSITESQEPRPGEAGRAAVMDVRQSNTVVLAGSGQTIVIGGLMKKTRKSREDSLSLLGGLFHSDESSEEKTELVILLTPEIMVGDAVDERFRIEQRRLDALGTAEGAVDAWYSANKR